MDEFQNALKVAFASEFSFYLKSHFFHWNVEGPNFVQYHDLFGKIYEEVHESIDTFAEQIRAVDTYTPGSFKRFSMLTTIDDEVSIPSAEQMIQELYQDNDKMIKIFGKVFDLAENLGYHGLSNFLADRQDAHSKHGWMLRSILK
jgi:starvation-inducible DNA-binding protein